MPPLSMSFAYYPQTLEFRAGSITLSDLSDTEGLADRLKSNDCTHKDWIYAPPRASFDLGHGEKHERPYSARIFGLPHTHCISHKSADGPEHLKFLVWCLSFFVGMRLGTTQQDFLDATPLRPGELVDFILSGCTEADALNLCDKFWKQHHADQKLLKRVVGIVHVLFLSQYPQHLCFERVMYLYAALDACFAVIQQFHETPYLTHGERIAWMCDTYQIQTPDWAKRATRGKSEISTVRNDMIHEALFFDEPLGFAIYGGSNQSACSRNVPVEMECLVCRLLVAILGKPDCEYVASPGNGQRHGLRLL